MIANELLAHNIHAVLLSLGPGLPLLLALACSTPALRQPVIHFLPSAAVPALLTPFVVPKDIVVTVPWFFMGGRMELDSTGQVFLSITAFVWMLAALTIRSRLASDPRKFRFIGYFLTAMAGNFGLILAQEMLGFYLFFALMSFAAYGLVAHEKSNEARRAGRIYLIMVILGEVAIFAALTVLADATHPIVITDIIRISFPSAVVVLLFIGFGVKIGALPFHVWMPLAYQTAPTPAATALAGAMINAGILGWLRFLPLGEAALPAGAQLFITAGSIATLYGLIAGLMQNTTRAVLAYSSISQMGIMTILVGMGLITPEVGHRVVAILTLYAVHHSLAKSSLFLSLNVQTGNKRQPSPWHGAGLLLPSLTLAGLPFTSGAIVKTCFKEIGINFGNHMQGFCHVFLPLTSIGTTLLMLHFIHLYRQADFAKDDPFINRNRTVWLISLIAVAVTFWLWPAAQSSALHSLELTKLWQSFWPLATGSLLAFSWSRLLKKRSTRLTVPAGDIVNLFEQFARFTQQRFSIWKPFDTIREKVRLLPGQHRPTARITNIDMQLRKVEKVLGRWEVVGLFYLALGTILLIYLL